MAQKIGRLKKLFFPPSGFPPFNITYIILRILIILITVSHKST